MAVRTVQQGRASESHLGGPKRGAEKGWSLSLPEKLATLPAGLSVLGYPDVSTL